jgi:glycosyltransferase involved in cell wall biosynthesis
MLDKPAVSICCVTYNHERYIRQCLDGFVLQKTNFPFEVLVHEDASLDSTASIVKEYELNYPQLFRCVYQSENQFLKQNTLVNILFKMAKGKYIALCEGDDYWTDPYKLQKQVDFLEANPDVAVTYHDSIKININNAVIAETEVGFENRKDFTNTELQKGAWLSTRTMCFRNTLTIPNQFEKVLNGDTFLTALMGEIGHGKYMPDIKPAVYRIHDEGIWSSISSLKKTTNKYKTFELMHDYFAGNGKKEIADYYKQQVLTYLMRAFYQASKTGTFVEMNVLLINNLKKQQYTWAMSSEVFKIYTWGILRKIFKK